MPYAHFTAFNVHDRIPNAIYFNGLWSHDWGVLFRKQSGPFPIEGSGLIKSYEWDFGDGSPRSFEPFVVHQFNNSGAYNVSLAVTDMDNETASTTKTIVFGDVPEILCSPPSMSFPNEGSAVGFFSQTLEIKNTGAGTLDYSISDDASWLSVLPTSGTSSGTVNEHTVSVDVSGLSQKTYNASVTITAHGGINSPQTVPVTLIIPDIYPPLSFSGRKVFNRSLSQAEYINVLTWEANPYNENIVKYRIYQVDGESQNLLVELDASTFQHWHRRVEKDKPYIYAICAMNDENKEGELALVSVK
jgi:PKD repeat protein